MALCTAPAAKTQCSGPRKSIGKHPENEKRQILASARPASQADAAIDAVPKRRYQTACALGPPQSPENALEPSIELREAVVRVYDRSLQTTIKRELVNPGSVPAAISLTILENISLKVSAGERLGIIGRNGSGKTTLLKAIAGIYPLASGERNVRGKIAPVISQGVGFIGELTVRQNIHLGLVYSDQLSRYSQEFEHRVLEFAELTDRADEQLKVLSSGFQARLAFALSLFEEPDILVLDEILATGDFRFFEKSRHAMLERMARTPISVFVSHDDRQIIEVCTRCILLVNGRLVVDDTPERVIAEYHRTA